MKSKPNVLESEPNVFDCRGLKLWLYVIFPGKNNKQVFPTDR